MGFEFELPERTGQLGGSRKDFGGWSPAVLSSLPRKKGRISKFL
jgi:hypothetical protein